MMMKLYGSQKQIEEMKMERESKSGQFNSIM